MSLWKGELSFLSSSQVISSSSRACLDADGAVKNDADDLQVRGAVSGVRTLMILCESGDSGPAILS